MLIALVVYDGVLNDECEAFRSVLSLVPNARFLTVGAHAEPYVGPGGSQPVDRTFEQIGGVEVVVVPGGLGCERAADDPDLRQFLQRMERSARYIAASSTGSVVLASAGLLHGEAAATHWLASDLLRKYGSETDHRRIAVRGNVITCEGRISAVDAAFALVERIDGSDTVDQIRAELLERGRPLLEEPAWWHRLLERLHVVQSGRAPRTSAPARRSATITGPGTATLARPDAEGVDAIRRADVDVGRSGGRSDDLGVTPPSVMMELVDDEELVRRIRRNAKRHQR